MNKSQWLFLFLGGFVLFNLLVFGYFFTKNITNKTSKNLSSSSHGGNSSIIAKVGEENIYQTDLDYELERHPQKDEPGIKKKLLDKLVLDSVILQGGAADGVITLDSSIFNSQEKNYVKRVNSVEQIKKKINDMNSSIKGTVISIWFRNNDYIGPQGLEKSKQIAFEKISSLRQQIVDKKITIDEAGQIITDDTSLAEIDRAWTNNALFHFSASPTKRITMSKEFDDKIRALNPGEVTEVYLVTNVDKDPAKRYEALYYVAQVTEKNTTTKALDYNSWLNQKKQTYAVTMY